MKTVVITNLRSADVKLK